MTSFDNRRSLLISEDDFSDDSLEHGAIPMIQVPKAIGGNGMDQPKTLHDELQPFALSPSKCNPGIAWEIRMDAIDEVDRLAKVCADSIIITSTRSRSGKNYQIISLTSASFPLPI